MEKSEERISLEKEYELVGKKKLIGLSAEEARFARWVIGHHIDELKSLLGIDGGLEDLRNTK